MFTLLLLSLLSLPSPRTGVFPLAAPRHAAPRFRSTAAIDNGFALPAPVPLAGPAAPAVFEPAPAQPDRWLAWDKFWHFSASFVSVGAGYHLCANRLNLDHAPATAVSLGGSFSLGLGKELLDRYGHGRRFSWKDMAANALGIAAGYLVFVHEY